MTFSHNLKGMQRNDGSGSNTFGECTSADANAVNSTRSAPATVATSAAMKAAGAKASGNNVSSLVAKSKKAAASLYTLLHAKNCRLGVNRCSHPGCPEAKLMYLHLKTCSMTPGTCCPTKYKGCEDARKLLAHYRRCRDIRARQAVNPKMQPHVCLVCTLVARQVKGNSERTRSSSPRSRTSKHLVPSRSHASNVEVKGCNVAHIRPRSTSPHRKMSSAAGTSFKLSQLGSIPSLHPKKMPPPPPRFPFSSPVVVSRTNPECPSPSMNDDQSAIYCALNATQSEEVNPADESMLGKSFDSASMLSRSRAHSLDIRQSNSRGLVGNQNSDHSNVEEKLEPLVEEQAPPRIQGRRRSASCSVPTSSRSCSTIVEEPVGEELQQILEGDT